MKVKYTNRIDYEFINNADSGIIQANKNDESWVYYKGDEEELEIMIATMLSSLIKDKIISEDTFKRIFWLVLETNKELFKSEVE